MKEDGGWDNSAFNPINTTLDFKGSTKANYFNNIPIPGGGVIHVMNYNSCEQGLSQTIKTVKLPPYKGIRDALAKGESPYGVANATGLKTWGTMAIPSTIVKQAIKEVG